VGIAKRHYHGEACGYEAFGDPSANPGLNKRGPGEWAFGYSPTSATSMALVGERGGGMELELAGAKEPESAREVRVGKQLHGFQDAVQTRSRNHMYNGTIVARDGDERTALSRANRRCRLPLEVPDAACIPLNENVYLSRVRIEIVEFAALG
jgi:hypothetical protein